MKIPKIIHQTWKTQQIPYDIYKKEWADSWKKYHSDWEHRLWTDEDNRAFIKRYYPWFLRIYDRYKKNICRVDAVRYFILYHYGGVYVDLDFECLKNIEPLLDNHGLVFGRMGEDSAFSHSIPNAFMASAKRNPFWLVVMRELILRRNENYVESATGSMMLHKVIKSCDKNVWLKRIFNNKIKIYESSIFFPFDWRKSSIYGNTLDQGAIKDVAKNYPAAYAVTYWTHNWED
ncbi:MAG: glycosyltransferase [Candidatus Omnitrophota bacterium]